MRRPPPLSRIVAFPVVGGLGLLAVAVTLLNMSGWSVARLTLNGAAFHGEPWRLFTCVLPHADILHLAFNVYWLWVFGTLVEEVYGHVRTLGIILLFAAGSMAAEYAVFVGGIGLSGVGYGLFAMLFALQRRDARFRDAVDERTSTVFVGWFVLCIVTTVMHVFSVANVAHAAGALLGWLLGLVVARPERQGVAPGLSRGLRASALAGLVVFGAASLAGASVLRPRVNLSHDGSEMARAGYDALQRGQPEEAVKAYREAVTIEPKSAPSWYNLGIAYEREENGPASLEAYERAVALDPGDPNYARALAAASCRKAFVAQQEGRQRDAAKLYKQCLDAGGGGAWAHANLSLAYHSLGRDAEALVELKEARRLDPERNLPESFTPDASGQ